MESSTPSSHCCVSPAGELRVVVFEDLHWADDATLDLLRVVGRRIRDLSLLFIGTFRDDEVGTEHPLRLALGDFSSADEAVLDCAGACRSTLWLTLRKDKAWTPRLFTA